MKAVYRTCDPATVSQYEANLAANEANGRAVKAFMAKVGAGPDAKVFGARLYAGGATFEGITWNDAPAPPGWRVPSGYPRRIEPDRRTKIGKAINAEMRALDYPSIKVRLGMPLELWDFDTSHRYWFGLSRVDDTLWVAWGIDPESLRDATEIGDQWERVPLSAYYAMVEAGNDPFTAEAES